jgi:hypothetical protein
MLDLRYNKIKRRTIMSLINSIYDAPIISTKDDCVSIVVISINGHSFAG